MSESKPAIGSVIELAIIKRTQAGWVLDGGALGQLLLSARELEAMPDTAAAERVRVFIYANHDGHARVTRQLPKLLPGEVGRLRVASMSAAGAFLDWGMPKDLLLPFAEQTNRPEPGRWLTVCVRQDRDDRPYASCRLDRYLEETCQDYRQGDAVPILIVQRTDLGYKVAVANRFWGLLSDAGRDDLRPGQRHTAYVQRLRDDHRLSLSLNPPGAAKTRELTEQILARLNESDGWLPLSDKSDPAAIRAVFHCSKNAFKQAIGKLYKAHDIVIEKGGIRLVNAGH